MNLYSCSRVLVVSAHIGLCGVPSTKFSTRLRTIHAGTNLVVFFAIYATGPYFQILATRPTRFWATRPQFWFMTLTTQPLEKWHKDQNHGTHIRKNDQIRKILINMFRSANGGVEMDSYRI